MGFFYFSQNCLDLCEDPNWCFHYGRIFVSLHIATTQHQLLKTLFFYVKNCNYFDNWSRLHLIWPTFCFFRWVKRSSFIFITKIYLLYIESILYFFLHYHYSTNILPTFFGEVQTVDVNISNFPDNDIGEWLFHCSLTWVRIIRF